MNKNGVIIPFHKQLCFHNRVTVEWSELDNLVLK